jgi:hypothetical protein
MVEEFGQRAGLTYDREAQADHVLHAFDENETPGVSQAERLLDGFFYRGVRPRPGHLPAHTVSVRTG